DGETFTFQPTGLPISTTAPVSTKTLPDGVVVTSSSGLLIWGTNTATVRTGLTAAEVVTTDGETFTFQPTGLPISTTAPVSTKTLPDGVVVTSSSGLLIWGTNTVTV